VTWVDDRFAPGRLEQLRAFVNTLDIARGPEALGRPADARDWLIAHGFAGRSIRLGQAELERTIALRESLRSVLLANGGAPPMTGAVEFVNDVAARAGLAPRLGEDGRAYLDRGARGIDAALGEVVVIIFDAIAAGTWSRLRACPGCGWAFYDASRNRCSRWCDMEICGNRAKQQALRKRRAPA
jgi:predicted RNA-binding Zn ribbon-like protein